MLAAPASGQSFFVFGPRGADKTTWLKQRFPEALYLDLLDHALYLDPLARPERLRELILPRHEGWIVLDEVQRVPLVLNEVHRLIEAPVDARVAYGGGLFAFEVKRSRRVRPADLRGLTQLKADYPMARCVLLYGGDRREYRDDIEIVPVADVLDDPGALLQAAASGSPARRRDADDTRRPSPLPRAAVACEHGSALCTSLLAGRPIRRRS